MTVRFGLLGTGYWAEQTHGAGLAAHPEVEFVGVWGRDPAKAAGLAGRLGVRAFVEVDALLAEVEAVAVALPPSVQAELAVRAAAAGRHLLLDKPVALTVEAADRVVAAVEHAGVASLVFLTNRFHPNVVAVLDEAVATGTGDGWDGARATMFASIFQPGNPYAGSVWRRQWGGLWDIGPHALSLVLPVLGPVSSVVAVDGPHATTHALLRHEGGAVTSLALTLDAPPAAVGGEIAFYGVPGVVEVPRGSGSAVEAFTEAVSQLVAAIGAGDTGHPCDVRFGREVVAILAAAQESVRTGRAVALLPR